MAKQIVCRHNVCAAKEYTTSQGEVKTQWVNLGTSVTFDDGSFLININALPTGAWWDGTLQGFKQEPRDQQQGGYRASAPASGGYPHTQTQRAYQQQAPAPIPMQMPPMSSEPSWEDNAPF